MTRARIAYFAQIAALLLAAFVVAAIQACASIPGSDRAARLLADAVSYYCFQPLEQRLFIRELVNREQYGGHQVQIVCAGDPAPKKTRARARE